MSTLIGGAPSPYFTGKERRSNEVELLREEVASHADEEIKRYAEIIDMQDRLEAKVEAYSRKSEARHNETQKQLGDISQGIEALTSESQEFFAMVKKAFPKDSDGDIDFIGHRKTHDDWSTQAREWRELMAYIRNERAAKNDWATMWRQVRASIVITTLLAVLSFVGVAAWVAFLRGPSS